MELWVEKYRPATLEEYVGNETIKNKIADYLKQGSIKIYYSTELQVQEKLH